MHTVRRTSPKIDAPSAGAARRYVFVMNLLLLAHKPPVGYTTGDQVAIGLAWIGIIVIAVVIMAVSSVRPPRLS